MTKHKTISIITAIVSLTLVIAGTIGLILLQKPLKEESLDIRQQASIDNGQVSVSSSPTSGSSIDVNQTTTISFQANTTGVQTDGVQLVFNIITDTISETPTISVPTASGLQNTYAQIENTSDGYLVSVIATPQQMGSTFSSNSPVTIAQLKFKPTSTGNIEINFDRERSKSIIHASNPPEDALTHLETITYTTQQVSDGQTGGTIGGDKDEHGCLTAAGYEWCEPKQKCLRTWEESCETGGVVVKKCNEVCSSNAECDVNQRCYNGHCRLVTNVSSTTCSELEDQGLNFGCNHYCADSRECNDQYACLENKCRRADNPDDALCHVPSTTIQNDITQNCNQTCSTNKDCAANLRCYYGACRLATNVSSTTCTAATVKTVSNLYAQPAAPTAMPKGGDIENQNQLDEDETDNTIPAAIVSKPSPSPTPSAKTSPAIEEETALDSIINSLEKTGVPVSLFPIIALGIGGLLLLLLIIPKIFSQKNNQNKNKVIATKPMTAPMINKQTTVIPQQPTTLHPQSPVATPPQSPMMKRVKEKGINLPDTKIEFQ